MRKLYITIICLFLANSFNLVFAQEANLQQAKFRKTVEEARKALDAEPDRGDLMVVIANNYAWQEKTDSALVYIEKAKQINYYNDDLFDSWLNILLWSHRYDSLLEVCKVAKEYKYSHDFPGNFAEQEFLPDEISGTAFYEPGNNKREQVDKQSLNQKWKGKYGY